MRFSSAALSREMPQRAKLQTIMKPIVYFSAPTMGVVEIIGNVESVVL